MLNLAPAILLCASALGLSLEPANLVVNADFERAFVSGAPADGWRESGHAPGVEQSAVRGPGLDGGAAESISVADDAPVTWYSCTQPLSGAAPGGEYALSGWVRTVDVREGAGAYLSVGHFGVDGRRIGYVDARPMLTGTSEWTRIVQAFRVPRDAVRTEVFLVMHGRGTAYFDRVQVEPGSSAGEWAAREGDSPIPARESAVAIYRDDVPVEGSASDPLYLREVAEAAGYECAFLDSEQLADPSALAYAQFDALILPYGSPFPAEAGDNLKTYLRAGGGLISLGGYPLNRLLARQAGEWRDVADLEPDLSGLAPIPEVADPRAGWGVGGREVAPAAAPTASGRQGVCLRLETPELRGWATLGSPRVEGLPEDSVLTAFYAKADSGAPWMSFEWVERDGSRWRSRIRLTTEWHLYGVPHASLEYWKDNPSVGRGGPDDRFRPAEAAHMSFGLTEEFVRGGQPYGVSVEPPLSGSMPFAPYAGICLNSSRGGVNMATFLEPPPDAISICDASAPIEDAVELRPSVGQCLVPAELSLPGPANGWSAVGQTAQGSAGAPLKARWTPILDAVDRYGRARGTGLAVMENYAGAYPGSSWAWSAIADRDLFPRGAANEALLFAVLLRRVTEGPYLFEAETRYAAARAGEEIAPTVRVANLAREPRQLTVRLAATLAGAEAGTRERTLLVPARSSTKVAVDLTAPATESAELLVLRWEVLRDGVAADRLERGVALTPEHPREVGPALGYADCVFSRGKGPEFLVGSQLYWGNHTNTGTDPLRWDRQLAAMADSGMHVARSFMNTPGGESEQAWRYRDALVALAARRGVSFFYSGVSWPTTDPAEVTKRAEVARKAAERYQAYPGWFVDIVNEPAMPVGQAPSDSVAFRASLAERYGTTEALRAAWGDELTEASLDAVEIKPFAGRWSSMRSVDTHRFMSERMRYWADETQAAIQDVSPERLVSLGHLQGFGDTNVTYDPIEGSRDLDFVNRHYYGAVEDYGAELAQVDMRTEGKGPSTGEFGATSHPGLASHFVYEGETTAAQRFSYVLHTCLGLGGAFALSWHWQDPTEDIFPCGLLHADGAPRERYYPFRDVAMLFRGLQPVYRPAEVYFVIPTSHRFGASKMRVQEAMVRGLRAMVAAHADFGVVSEDTLASLPPTARVLVWPVPWCPTDETYGRVREFVAGGGTLLVSGDLSFDETRARTRTDRLTELCGARFVRERYPDIQYAPADGVLALDAASAIAGACRVADLRGPCLEVEPTTAQKLAEIGGVPVALDNRLGMGRVVWLIDPVELHADPWPVYAALLGEMGLTHAVSPAPETLHSHRVHGADGAVAYLLFNTAKGPLTVTIADLAEPVEITLAPNAGGAVLFGGGGELLAVEGRAVSVSGSEVLRASETAALASLGGDLRQSSPLVLLPMGQSGEVSAPSAAELEATVGEVVGGRWRVYETLRSGGSLELDPARARSWVLLARPDDATSEARLLERM